MAKGPRLTIGLPVYNGEQYIEECIASIVKQTYTDFRLVVCDNCSTDRTKQIVLDWCSADERIQFHQAPSNRGAASNFNWCFSLGSGDLFKWCAVDDLMEPELLQRCVDALDRAPDAVLAYSGAIDIDETQSYIGEIYDNRVFYAFGAPDPAVRFRDLICREHSCITVFGVIRRAALERSSLIGPYPGSDKVLLAELGLQGAFVRVGDDLIRHREHSKRSVTENPRLRDRARWFNSAHRGPVFPYFRLLREYTRAALVNDRPLREKLRCLPQVARWLVWGGWTGLLDDATYYLRPQPKRAPAAKEPA